MQQESNSYPVKRSIWGLHLVLKIEGCHALVGKDDVELEMEDRMAGPNDVQHLLWLRMRKLVLHPCLHAVGSNRRLRLFRCSIFGGFLC